MLFRFVDRNVVRNFFGVQLLKIAKENTRRNINSVSFTVYPASTF